jgi:hypothetical protein
MKNRSKRKQTLANKELAIRAEIRTGLAGGERFRNIARFLADEHGIDKDKALDLVVHEYAQKVNQQVQQTTMED